MNKSLALCVWAIIPTRVALGTAESASVDAEADISVTVYSSADPAGFDPQSFIAQQRSGGTPMWARSVPGFGVVRDVRTMKVPQGEGTLSLTDVAQFIDPTTVSFADLTSPRTAVRSQRFEFDLVSSEKMLQRWIDKPVSFSVSEDGANPSWVTGTLLSAAGGTAVLRIGDELNVVPLGTRRITLPDAAGVDLTTRPTLVWNLRAPEGGQHQVRTTYETAGMTWRADYTLVLSADNTSADLAAWMSLLNLCGASFHNAGLKLVAGDVHRVHQEPGVGGGAMPRALASAAIEHLGMEEREFFEYHMYSLPGRIDLPQNSTTQVSLFPSVSGAKVHKELIVDAMRGYGSPASLNTDPHSDTVNAHATVAVVFRNDKESNLGMPLPAGKVRVFQMDQADSALEFIGEDVLDHTPRNESVRVNLGEAFDVVATRKVTDFAVDTGRKTMSETISVEVRNQKEAAQSVLVREHLWRGLTAKVSQESALSQRLDASTVQWSLELPPEGKQTILYTVVYTW